MQEKYYLLKIDPSGSDTQCRFSVAFSKEAFSFSFWWLSCAPGLFGSIQKLKNSPQEGQKHFRQNCLPWRCIHSSWACMEHSSPLLDNGSKEKLLHNSYCWGWLLIFVKVLSYSGQATKILYDGQTWLEESCPIQWHVLLSRPMCQWNPVFVRFTIFRNLGSACFCFNKGYYLLYRQKKRFLHCFCNLQLKAI